MSRRQDIIDAVITELKKIDSTQNVEGSIQFASTIGTKVKKWGYRVTDEKQLPVLIVHSRETTQDTSRGLNSDYYTLKLDVAILAKDTEDVQDAALVYLGDVLLAMEQAEETLKQYMVRRIDYAGDELGLDQASEQFAELVAHFEIEFRTVRFRL